MAPKHLKPPLAWFWDDAPGFFNVLRFPLTFLSWFYELVMRLRSWLYQKGLFTTKRVPCHVVSIGNMTTGGTGKTPMTIYFAERWQKQGCKVGIVSRGYRRNNKATLVLVSDGVEICATTDAAGDEAFLMAQRLSGVPIVVCADRFKGCKALIARFKVEVILLDDAFQHLKIHRDQNILIIDASDPFGNGHLLPRGPLREPLRAIKRSDFLIFTRVEKDLPMEDMMQCVVPYQPRMLQSAFEATALIDLNTGKISEPSLLNKKRVLPFCGIGNPDAFLRQLALLGTEFEDACIFEDHYNYKKSDLEGILYSAERKKGTWIVTTEKDAVKIKSLMTNHTKIYALRIGPVFKKASEEQLERLFEK